MLTAAILRRVAEAADGHRTGEPIWVSIDASNLTQVAVFTDEESARLSVGDRMMVFGPFLHETDTSAVEAVSLTVRNPDGSERTIELDESTDAIFFTSSAVEKFMVPYYVRLYGPGAGDILTESVTLPLGHDRSTRWLPQ